jgi:hypothetical protein
MNACAIELVLSHIHHHQVRLRPVEFARNEPYGVRSNRDESQVKDFNFLAIHDTVVQHGLQKSAGGIAAIVRISKRGGLAEKRDTNCVRGFGNLKDGLNAGTGRDSLAFNTARKETTHVSLVGLNPYSAAVTRADIQKQPLRRGNSHKAKKPLEQ